MLDYFYILLGLFVMLELWLQLARSFSSFFSLAETFWVLCCFHCNKSGHLPPSLPTLIYRDKLHYLSAENRVNSQDGHHVITGTFLCKGGGVRLHGSTIPNIWFEMVEMKWEITLIEATGFIPSHKLQKAAKLHMILKLWVVIPETSRVKGGGCKEVMWLLSNTFCCHAKLISWSLDKSFHASRDWRNTLCFHIWFPHSNWCLLQDLTLAVCSWIIWRKM